MKGQRRYVAAGVVIAATAVTALGPVTMVDAAALAAPPRAAEVRGSVVTLITGDRLTLMGSDQVGIERGPGRQHITFSVTSVRGHLNVTPSDARALIRAGRVDERLFDVTALTEAGYDDRRDDLPLIVTQPVAGLSKAARAARPVRPAVPRGLRVTRELPAVKGVAVRAARDDRGTAWAAIRARGTASTVPTVWLDALRKPTLDVSVPQIGAPAASAAGLTGHGVTVAVVDGGIDATHPDLAGKVVAAHNFTDDGQAADLTGHGTHVASTVAGTGAASDGRFTGVAPGAQLVDAKVCDDFGCPESAIIAGMQWAVAEQHVKIVNMSLGSTDEPGIDPVEQAVQDLTDQYGALFVVAAGNSGEDRTIGSPGSAPAALTVGAVDSHDALANFSSRGPAVDGSALKPDLTAPGVDITAARGKDSGRPAVDGQYTTISGTSMAAPHVAGSAAILAQQHGDWSGQQLKAALMASAVPNPAIGSYGQGAGRVDVARAITQAITTSPASVSFGLQFWPHADDLPVTSTVTYRNPGAAAVTLDLAVQGTGAAPAGTFSLSTSRITVPGGGQAEVTLTADTRVAGSDGFLGGFLVATGGGAVVHTPFAVEKEAESYGLDLAVTNRAGQPATDYYFRIFDLDRAAFYSPYDPDGTVSARLPKGRYLIQATVLDGDPATVTELISPVLDLHAAASIALDARRAGPVTVSVERPSARQHLGLMIFAADTGFGRIGFGEVVTSFDELFVGGTGRDVRVAGLSTAIKGQWARPNPDGTVDGSPYTYTLGWEVGDRVPTGFHRVVRDRDLARVDATYLAQLPAATGERFAVSSFADNPYGAGEATTFRTPARRTEFYSAGSGIRWFEQFNETASVDGREDGVSFADFGRQFAAGRTYRDTWNRPMFGPGFPGGYDPAEGGYAVRSGDQILLGELPLFGDQFGRAGISTGIPPSAVTLERDGVAVPGGDGAYEVSAGEGTYKLTATVVRPATVDLSTRVSAVWTFRSGHVDTDTVAALHLLAVRFHPVLDARGTARAGRTVRVPVSVEAQLGSSAPVVRSLSVAVSYDEGATWTVVPVHADGRGTFVTLHHPAGPSSVSLRATAVDGSGDSVTQTITRAYRTA